MPVGEMVTVPEPLPASVTVRRYVLRLKVAVTDLASVMLTAHMPVPEQPAPAQPMKVEPVKAVAVNVTMVL